MLKIFRTPRTSVNQNWMKLTFFSLTIFNTSFVVFNSNMVQSFLLMVCWGLTGITA